MLKCYGRRDIRLPEFLVRKSVTYVYRGYVTGDDEESVKEMVDSGSVELEDVTDYRSDYESVEVEEA